MSGDLLAAAVATGQREFTVTPLEMVQAFAALANGGKLLEPQPYLPNGKAVFVRQVVSPETPRIMRGLLGAVVTEGTGQKAAALSYSTAGKTGSSPKTSNGHSGFASFAGFAPVREPRIAVYVAFENPPKAIGGLLAAPVFGLIVESSLRTLGVSADR
jgi:cell division protein FtsI/penicillin-binding protein 2